MLCMCSFQPNSICSVLAAKYVQYIVQLPCPSLSCNVFLSGTPEDHGGERSDDFDHVVCSAHLRRVWKYPRWSALCQISSHQTCALILDLLMLRERAEIYGSRTAYHLTPALSLLTIMVRSYLWGQNSRFDPVALELNAGRQKPS